MLSTPPARVDALPTVSSDPVLRRQVLIADDDRVSRMLLKSMFEQQGYVVQAVEDGAQAVAAFQASPPDLVALDVNMPVMDGYAAAQAMRANACARFVPIIFVTSATDEASLARCIASGGDDFLSKPYNRVILRAKIDALMRIRDLYETARAQRDALAGYQARIVSEQEFAQHIFRTVVERRAYLPSNVRRVLLPSSVFNGDVVLTASTPAGGIHIFVGDFTGHGLGAAIGTLLVADAFYRMTLKGFALGEILIELNRKLHGTLPTGMFCAGAALSLDAQASRLSLWNGGLPELLVYSGAEKRRFPSRHLPLGIVGKHEFDGRMESFPVTPNDRVYLYTDGLIEAQAGNTIYGQERMEALFETGSGDSVGDVTADISTFLAGAEQADDITLVEVTCALGIRSSEPAPVSPAKVSAWRLHLKFEVDQLRQVDPAPVVLQAMGELRDLGRHRESLYLIFGELLSNAVEHGLLGLDSGLKNSPDGFLNYYTARASRLAQMRSGGVVIECEYAPHADGGILTICIEDSGAGFDHGSMLRSLDENRGLHGRGIPLLRSLCRSVCYPGCGNRVEVVYAWE